MRKKFTIFLILLFFLELIPINFSSAADLATKLMGRILLQVEDVGQAWYIEPETKERAFLGRPADAFRIMRELGLGISEKDYNSFNGKAPNKLSGKILLRVGANGEAYYANPTDLKLYYLGRPADAFDVMRKQGLGITDKDLAEVPISEKYAEQTANTYSTGSVNSTSFIKTYHVRDNTDGFGVFPTKDGGYVLTGDTVWDGGMAAPYPYIVKTDAKGNKLWSRDYSSSSNALGNLSSSYVGRLAVETTDGNIVTAADIVDFNDAKYEAVKEEYGDILVTKLNTKGGQLWSILLGDYSLDRPLKMWALPNGGILLLARFMKTGYGNDIADTDAVPKYIVLIKIDKNGKVQSSKKMNWDVLDMQRLADGSYIALANITVPKAEQPEHILGSEVTTGDIPTIIKLDSNLNVTWAKSMEMIPSEINAPTSITDTGFTMGKTKIRVPGGDFRTIQPTPDGGFLAFGFNNLLLTQGLSGGATISKEDTTLRPFVAVKVDAAGNYQWARKLTINLVSGGVFNDFHVVRTVDGHFIIMKGVVRDSDGLDAKTHEAAQERKAFLDKCAELKAECNNEENVIPELQPFVKAQNDALAVLADASAGNIGLIKTDADFNPMWIKQVDMERNLAGYGIQPTADNGVVVVGSMLTTKMHMVMGSWYPYQEAALIKVDVNGGAGGCAAVSDHSQATVEDQSQYLIMQDMNVAGAKDMVSSINKKVNEKISTIQNTTRDICQYQKNSAVPINSYLSYLNSNISTSQPGMPATSPVAKTWALINYENTIEVAVDGEKNKSIHEELLPILNQVYNNEVKVKDNMESMWLTYIFPRLVTRADVEAVQKKYEALGYKIDESEGGNLWVSKVGQTLHITFSIENSMTGKLEVLF